MEVEPGPEAGPTANQYETMPTLPLKYWYKIKMKNWVGLGTSIPVGSLQGWNRYPRTLWSSTSPANHYFLHHVTLLWGLSFQQASGLGFFFFFCQRHHSSGCSVLWGFLGFPQARAWARKARIYYLLNTAWPLKAGSELWAFCLPFLGAHLPCLVPTHFAPSFPGVHLLQHSLAGRHSCRPFPLVTTPPETTIAASDLLPFILPQKLSEPSSPLIVQVALFWTHSNWAP